MNRLCVITALAAGIAACATPAAAQGTAERLYVMECGQGGARPVALVARRECRQEDRIRDELLSRPARAGLAAVGDRRRR